MSSKTEVIYTYKSPVVIPPANIHGLQNGSTGKISIGILDTQDYDYTYVSGLSGSYTQKFLPLGEDDTTTIISNVGGGTANMLLQNEPASLTIDSISLNVKDVKKYQELNIVSATLEYMYDYVPPLIIDGATLNCTTQSILAIEHANLNLKLKKKIMNLPVILGAEFCIYGTRDFGFFDGPPGAGVWKRSRRGWRTSTLVIHDEGGANFPAFRYANTNKPFDAYQTFTGTRKYEKLFGDVASSVIRVKHPFGNPLSTTELNTLDNINSDIIRNQNLDFKWFIYNGLVDSLLRYPALYAEFKYRNGRQKYNPPDNGGGYWIPCQTQGNIWNAMISGNTKLFDHASLYNTYFQSHVNPGALPNPDGLNSWGQYLQTNLDNQNKEQSSFITDIFYTTFENFYTGSYTISVNGSKYSSSPVETSYTEILNLNNVNIKNINSRVATDPIYSIGYQEIQQGKNYFYNYLNGPSEFGENLNIRFPGNAKSTRNNVFLGSLDFSGGIIDLSVLKDEITNSQLTSIDTMNRLYSFSIKDNLIDYKDRNNQTLNITDLTFNSSGSTAAIGLYGNVHSDGNTIENTHIIDSSTLSTAIDTNSAGTTLSLGSIVNTINNIQPKNLPLDISSDSNYSLVYKFSGKPTKRETINYNPNGLQIGSAENDGEVLLNPSAQINIASEIRNSISNYGTTGRIIDINSLELSQGSNDRTLKLNNTFSTNLYTKLNEKLVLDLPSSSIDISGYYDFSGNTASNGYTGQESINFNIEYSGTTFIYSQQAQLLNFQGQVNTLDFTAGLTALIDPYSQEIHTIPFRFLGITGTSNTYYTQYGLPLLGISGSNFNPNAIVLWNTADVKVQYNTNLNQFGQLLKQNFVSDDLTYVQSIDIINNNPIFEEREYTVPTNLLFPIANKDINFIDYSNSGYYMATGTISHFNLPKRDPTGYNSDPFTSGVNFWVKLDTTNPLLKSNYINADLLTIPGNYFGKLIVFKNRPFSAEETVDDYFIVYTKSFITPATDRPTVFTTGYRGNDYPSQNNYIHFKTAVSSRTFELTLSDNTVPFIPSSALGDPVTGEGQIVLYSNNQYQAIPSIPILNIGSTGSNNVFGKDSLDLSTAKLYIDYSYGEGLYSEPFNQVVDIGNTYAVINPSTTTTVSKYMFTKPERILTFPYEKFSGLTELYLVNIAKNPTGYTFNQTPFNWDIYNPATFKGNKIINYDFSGITSGSNIDKLISLNDFTLNRTPGTNKFNGIKDLENDPPIDLISRNTLDNISLISRDNATNKITNIILNNSTNNSVPYLHRFFKFDYLNDDKELFLLVSSSITGSTATIAGISGLYVSLADNDPNPFITSRNDSTYGLTNQLITFDLSNDLQSGQYFNYNNTYLDPDSYGTGATSYLIDVSYSSSAYPNQHSLANFGFTGGSTASVLIKGLMPGITYRNNDLTYTPFSANSEIINFEFYSGNTGIIFSCNSNLQQNQNKVFSYNLRISDASYTSYSSSDSGILTTLGKAPDINYSLCIDFNDPSVIISKDSNDSVGKKIVENLLFDTGKQYTDFTIKGLERGKQYLGRIYLVSKINNSFTSNTIFTTPLSIPLRKYLLLGGSTLTSPYSYKNSITDVDVYRKTVEEEISSMNSFNGYLYVMGPPGNIYSKERILQDTNNIYGSFNPITRNLPITIRNLDAGTTYSNLTLRYDNVGFSNTPSIIGSTSTSNGLIISEYANNTIIQNIPTFTTPSGSTSGFGMTGIVNIQNPTFYNSYLEISNFNFYRNDPSNSYPEIYGGTALVVLNSIVVGRKTLNPLVKYPTTFGFNLNENKLNLGENNILNIHYQWTEFNGFSYSSFSAANLQLTYSVLISPDRTSIKIPFTTLITKTIPKVNIVNTIVGDMPLNDLKCDLVVKASGLTGQNPFFFKGNWESGNTYYSNWTVSLNSNEFYALMGATMSKGNSPEEDRAWVKLDRYLPAGYHFNTGNQRDNTGKDVYLSGPVGYNNWTPFIYDTDDITSIDFGDRYLKLTYNNGYQNIYNNLFPNRTYNLQYIRSQILLNNNTNLTLHSGSTFIGQTKTLVNYVGADSLTGPDISNIYTFNDFHYNGLQSYLTDGKVSFGYDDKNYYFSLTGTTESLFSNSRDWIKCLVNGSPANSSSIVTMTATNAIYQIGDIVLGHIGGGGIFGFVKTYTTGPGFEGGVIPTDDPGSAWLELKVDNYGSGTILNDAHRYVDGQISSIGNTVYIDSYTDAQNIVSAGVTFTNNPSVYVYQPQSGVDNQIYDITEESNLAYNTLTLTPTLDSNNYNKLSVNISGFSLEGFNLDDYFVIKGGTFNKVRGYPGDIDYSSVTGSINFYKEYKLREYYSAVDGGFSGLVIDKLTENTTYTNFNISYRYSYTNLLSNSINLDEFSTINGLEIDAGLRAGGRVMYATINSVTLEGISQPTLFRTNNPRNLFHFKMYRYVPGGTPTDANSTDFNDITGTTNISIPANNLKLAGADQGVGYNRIYFHYRLIDTDGSENIFERTYDI